MRDYYNYINEKIVSSTPGLVCGGSEHQGAQSGDPKLRLQVDSAGFRAVSHAERGGVLQSGILHKKCFQGRPIFLWGHIQLGVV